MSTGLRAMPVLPALNVEDSAAYLERGFGFSPAGFWRNDDGLATFSICRLGQVTLALQHVVEAPPTSGWAAYVYVEDVEALAELAHAAGVDLSGPEDRAYGCREIECIDPSGNRICFATDLNPGLDGPGL